jgi:hypothetical protein
MHFESSMALETIMLKKPKVFNVLVGLIKSSPQAKNKNNEKDSSSRFADYRELHFGVMLQE